MDKCSEKYNNLELYCQKLSKWVNEQRFNMFTQQMSQQFLMGNKNLSQSSSNQKNGSQKEELKNQSHQDNTRNDSSSNQSNNQNDNTENDLDDMPIQGQRYSLPHPLRRIMAEFIDYVLLTLVKVSIMYLIHGDLTLNEIMESIDVDFRYLMNKHKLTSNNPAGSDHSRSSSSNTFSENNQDGMANGNSFMNAARQGGGAAPLNPFESLTLDIVYAEIINRILVTLYEAICLSGVFRNISATPGKYLMRLRVVQCKDLFDLPLNRVEVLPGGCPSLLSSVIRAIIKNFAMVFFLPLCMTALVFSHHRTSYDLIAGTIVVKVPPPRQHRLNMAGVAARNPPRLNRNQRRNQQPVR